MSKPRSRRVSVPSDALLADLRTLERSFRQRAAHRESEYRRTDNHGAHLIGVHVGMCADDLRDLLKRHTANKAISGFESKP